MHKNRREIRKSYKNKKQHSKLRNRNNNSVRENSLLNPKSPKSLSLNKLKIEKNK